MRRTFKFRTFLCTVTVIRSLEGAVNERRIDDGSGCQAYYNRRGKAAVFLRGGKQTQRKDIRKAKGIAEDTRSQKKEEAVG
jgi:putative addiction module killer protein